MNHTFIFCPGVWNAVGKYYDVNGQEILVEGRATINHSDNLWVNEGVMKLLLPEPVELQNRYEIIPFQRDFTTWISMNPSIGKLIGKFMIIEDTILSQYVSEDGVYSGLECMIKINDMVYKTRGFAYKGIEKLSSWSVVLTRI